METALANITRDELRARIDSGGGLVLVDALAPMSFARERLPGAINIPPEWVDERAPSRITDPAAEIVVYCGSETCDNARIVGLRLRQLGYTNVRHYAGGKADWVAAGLPLERGAAAR